MLFKPDGPCMRDALAAAGIKFIIKNAVRSRGANAGGATMHKPIGGIG